ncbi:fructosamine kinase family protein [Ruania albidiflava]|uniref:fructosamine kinase family protein n=1 Tax=Ruania albidiflava TaxID=366586 RepID=UPI0003B64044|nr:fructosamine kinase family protein [Ruania albidiflava]
MAQTYTKSDAQAPTGFFATEAAGLRWLAAAGGAPVVGVHTVSDTELVLDRLHPVRPTPGAARNFGRGLARTHAAGADSFGALPPGAAGYWFGPLSDPLPLPEATAAAFGEFYAQARVWPLTERCRQSGAIGQPLATGLQEVCRQLRDGRWDEAAGAPVRPARLHGDLWSGNLMWTTDGVVLIDPAACGGHPEADLAMLELFGAPHLEEILAGYGEVAELAPDWRARIGLHQLFPLLVHALLFGGSYASATGAAVDQLLG